MRFGRLVLLRPADLELDVLDSLEHLGCLFRAYATRWGWRGLHGGDVGSHMVVGV